MMGPGHQLRKASTMTSGSARATGDATVVRLTRTRQASANNTIPLGDRHAVIAVSDRTPQLSGVLHARRASTAPVLSGDHGLKVCGIDAAAMWACWPASAVERARVADVIDVITIRNWTNEPLVHDAMRELGLAVNPQSPITKPSERACPRPAFILFPSCQIEPVRETINGDAIGKRAMAFAPSVARRAQTSRIIAVRRVATTIVTSALAHFLILPGQTSC